ncbi:Y+L amino acid transporter 2-like isoform X2 [Ornithodoros turicata]|uniref:Y+L amino acid transporter 2-like isoform X2 n=1 Tax=Ornithodoros turicata TaxID=34597 RepID=UPI0031391EAE
MTLYSRPTCSICFHQLFHMRGHDQPRGTAAYSCPAGTHCKMGADGTPVAKDGSSAIKDGNTVPTCAVEAKCADGTVPLQKQVGLFGGTALLIGCVIGSGIFVTPSVVYREAGSVGMDLIIWGLGGLISLLGGLCYAELGSLLPASGGDYAYLCAAGKVLPRCSGVGAFLSAWAQSTVTDPVGAATQGLAFASYVLKPIYHTCNPPYLAVTLVAATFIGLTTFINCISTKVSARVQDLLSSIKCLVLISIILTAAVLSYRVNHLTDVPLFANTNKDPGRITLAIYGALFSYSGWKYVNFVAAEMTDPHRQLPRVIAAGLLTVTVIYILTNVAYFLCLDGQEMLRSEAVAVSFAQATWGVKAAILVPVFVSISAFGCACAASFCSSRVVLAAARQGHLPRFLSYVHAESAVPLSSTIVRGFLGVVYAVFAGSLDALIEAGVFIDSIFDVLGVVSLFVLRHTMKETPRAYKVPIVIAVVRLLIGMGLVVIPLVSAARYTPYILVLLILGAGMIYYWLFVHLKLRLPGSDAFNIFVQKVLFSAPCANELEDILAVNKVL